MIQFSCACGRRLEGREEDVGKPASCPLCGAAMAIPSAQVAQMRDKLPRRADGVRLDAIRTDCSDERSREVEPDEDHVPPRKRAKKPDAAMSRAEASLVFGLLAFPCLIGSIFLTGVPAVIFGALALRDIAKGNGRIDGINKALVGIITGFLGLLFSLGVLLQILMPAFAPVRVRGPTASGQEHSNLKQLGVGMYNFHDCYKAFPQAAAYRSPEGKPLLSWRVALLPYIDQHLLYERFKLDEPWDSPHNIKLLPLMPKTYKDHDPRTNGSALTRCQVLVGPGTIFEDPLAAGDKVGGKKQPLFLGPNAPLPGLHVNDILDGVSDTILIVMADAAVPWSKPEDLSYDPNGPLPGFSNLFPGFFHVVLADCSVKKIPRGISERTLRNAITCNDRQPPGQDW